jgi:hypothetical protein
MFDAQNKSGLFDGRDNEFRINKLQEFCIKSQSLIGELQFLAEERHKYAEETKSYLEASSILANERLAFIEASNWGKLLILVKKVINSLKS